TRYAGYAVSQRIRKRIEEAFGWMKTVGGLRKTRYRGRERVQMHAYLVGAAYNLLRIARLVPVLPWNRRLHTRSAPPERTTKRRIPSNPAVSRPNDDTTDYSQCLVQQPAS